MSTSTTKPPCASALRSLAEGSLADWTGLPSSCSVVALAAVFEGGEARYQGTLSGNPAMYRIYRISTQREAIYAWFDDNDEVFLITIEKPTIKGAVEELLTRLGLPEKRLSSLVGYHADAHQWIYAQRGITLFVREHKNEVARVAVYQPSSVEFYEEYLGAKDQKIYRPRR